MVQVGPAKSDHIISLSYINILFHILLSGSKPTQAKTATSPWSHLSSNSRELEGPAAPGALPGWTQGIIFGRKIDGKWKQITSLLDPIGALYVMMKINFRIFTNSNDHFHNCRNTSLLVINVTQWKFQEIYGNM